MRILSLDGGGTWALLQAMALGSLYGDATPGREILRRFDYVAAKSGGNIVLGGLLNDWPPEKIAGLFLDEQTRKTIFVARGWGIFRPGVARWSTAGKLEGLQTVLGDGTLAELAAQVPRDAGRPPLQIVITAYDYDRHRARFFRSNPASASSNSASTPPVTITQAVHASSTAPVIYFDEPADLGSFGHSWDGGVTSYDNPVLAGLTEAIANGANPENIACLSLGTANAVLPLKGTYPAESDVLVRDIPKSTILNDVKTLAKSIVADPPDAATFIAYFTMRHSLPPDNNTIRHVRLNPLIQPVLRNRRWEFPGGLRTNSLGLPAEDMFERLVKLDMDAVADSDVKLIEALGRAWLGGGEITNQAIRASDTFEPQIGFGTFVAAKTRWLTLKLR